MLIRQSCKPYINILDKSFQNKNYFAAASLAIGTLYVEQETKSKPIFLQKSIDFGSPPCSPQIPILIWGLAILLLLEAIFNSSPTPSRSSDLNGSSGNISHNRRRAFSMRFIGDDVRYIDRGGETSPPFKNINLQSGDPLRTDWFPIVWNNWSNSPYFW